MLTGCAILALYDELDASYDDGYVDSAVTAKPNNIKIKISICVIIVKIRDERSQQAVHRTSGLDT